jgi:hypothetical protein
MTAGAVQGGEGAAPCEVGGGEGEGEFLHHLAKQALFGGFCPFAAAAGQVPMGGPWQAFVVIAQVCQHRIAANERGLGADEVSH